jgi:hypothetical protein
MKLRPNVLIEPTPVEARHSCCVDESPLTGHDGKTGHELLTEGLWKNEHWKDAVSGASDRVGEKSQNLQWVKTPRVAHSFVSGRAVLRQSLL